MKKLKAWQISLIVVGVVIILLTWLTVGSYNGLIKQNENVKTYSSNIDTQLQRRNDLIPNLVNTVKGYAAQETKIFTELAEARAKLAGATTPAEKATADQGLTNALSRLLVVVENYPELKSSQQFQSLMDELAGTENRISVARKDYNGAAQKYNQYIKSFPKLIIANMFGFKSVEYFEAQESAKQVPNVNFQ